MSCSCLDSLKWVYGGLCRGVLLGLVRGILGVLIFAQITTNIRILWSEIPLIA